MRKQKPGGYGFVWRRVKFGLGGKEGYLNQPLAPPFTTSTWAKQGIERGKY